MRETEKLITVNTFFGRSPMHELTYLKKIMQIKFIEFTYAYASLAGAGISFV